MFKSFMMGGFSDESRNSVVPIHVLIQKSDEEIGTEFVGTEFVGTGFVIARIENIAYVLTCAHVIPDIPEEKPDILEEKPDILEEKEVKVYSHTAKVVAYSPKDGGVDLALLEVEGLKGEAFLSLSTSAKPGDLFRIYGYYKFDCVPRTTTIEGELGKSDARGIQGRSVPDWNLLVTGEEPIRPRCSGAPVLNCQNKVIGIITHETSNGTGRRGSAISIEALLDLLQEIVDEKLNDLRTNIIEQLENSPPRRFFNIEFDNRFKNCASVEKLTLHETAYQNWYCLQFDFKCGRQEVTVPPGCLLDQRREIPGGMLRFGLRRGVLKLKTSDGSSFTQYRSVCEPERRNGGIGWCIPSEIEDASQQFSITDKGIDEPIWEFEPKSRGNVKLDYMAGKGEISLGVLYLPNTDILRDKQIAAELVKEWYVQIYLADYKLAEGRFSGESLTEETNGVDLEILLPDQPLTKNQKLAIFAEFYSICLDPRLQPYLSNVKSVDLVDLNGEKLWTS